MYTCTYIHTKTQRISPVLKQLFFKSCLSIGLNLCVYIHPWYQEKGIFEHVYRVNIKTCIFIFVYTSVCSLASPSECTFHQFFNETIFSVLKF